MLANVNVVGPDSVAQSIVIDGDKQFYIPTEFKAQNLSFTKSGEGYQALCLPFITYEGLGIVNEDGTIDQDIETFSAGEPVLFEDAVSINESGWSIYPGFFAETERGYIFDGTSFVFAENISPFTYVWDDPNGIKDLKDLKDSKDLKDPGNIIYTIAGQRVGKPTKGLYIVGGKKYLVK